MKINPIGDMVLLKAKDQERKSVGGIIIPDTAKEKPMFGTVIAAGPGGNVDGKEIVMAQRSRLSGPSGHSAPPRCPVSR